MNNVLILGGTGFVGRHLCERLNRAGIRATVPTRRLRNAEAVQTLPLVQPLEADINDAQALARLLPGHDAVVNLVAVLHGSRPRFEQVHVELPRKLAQAMQASGMRRLVHVSALGASASGPSDYQATKAAGEALLQSAGLELTILRPSVIFGAEDRFLNLFATLQKRFPIMPLAGAQARLQPVWVGDVAQALLYCLQHPATSGQIVECAGPEVFSLADLVRLAGRLSGHERPVLPLPMALGHLQAALMQCLPGEPLLSRDNLRSLQVDNVASGQLPGLHALGITPQALEPLAARYLEQAGRADPLLALRQNAAQRK